MRNLFLAICLTLTCVCPASASLIHIDSVHILAKEADDNVSFFLAFSEPPTNWNDVAFQFQIIGDTSLRHPWKFDSVVASYTLTDEDKVVLLNASQYMSGGFTMKTPVAYNGNSVAFDLPLSLVSQHHVGGVFDYVVESYFRGSTTSRIEHQSVLHLPEPKALGIIIGALLIFAAMILYYKCQTRKRGV
jgi:hypothetical protein